jgi:hypothetical protein
MSTREVKKRELVCPHTDCFYYSAEQVLVEGEWILLSYCSNPNNDLIDKGTSCRLYHLDWQKQVKKNGNEIPSGTNGIEILRQRKFALLKMLRWTMNQLDAEEREVIFDLVNELKQQEEDSLKRKKQTEGGQATGVDQFLAQPPPEESKPDKFQVSVGAEEETSSNGNLIEFSLADKTFLSRQVQEEEPKPDQRSTKETIQPELDRNLPEAIVQKFIECWNTQDFESEYNCLSKRLKAVPKEEYILSRQHAFADAMKNQNNGNLPKQQLAEISSRKIDGNFAYVECIKSEPAGRFEKEYQQSYSLLRENGEWKISKVRTSPVAKAKRKMVDSM